LGVVCGECVVIGESDSDGSLMMILDQRVPKNLFRGALIDPKCVRVNVHARPEHVFAASQVKHADTFYFFITNKTNLE
jgi:hypothetical protein